MLEKNIKGTFIKYICTIIIAGLITIICLVLRDFFTQNSLKEKYLNLADSFTIPGLLLILFSILIFLSNKGALNAISYMFRRFGQMLIPFNRRKDEKYSDYVASKEKISGYWFIFFVGAGYLIIGIIFTCLFLFL